MPLQVSIDETKQLLHVDGLGVEDFKLDSRELFRVSLVEGIHGILENLPASRLPTLGTSYQHVAVTGVLAVEKLNHLLDLLILDDQTCRLDFSVQGFN